MSIPKVFEACFRSQLHFSHSAPVAEDSNTVPNQREEIDAVLAKSTAVSAVLDSAFRHLQSSLNLSTFSGWEHSGTSFLSPVASSNQIDYVKTRTDIEMHLVQLFSSLEQIPPYCKAYLKNRLEKLLKL